MILALLWGKEKKEPLVACSKKSPAMTLAGEEEKELGKKKVRSFA